MPHSFDGSFFCPKCGCRGVISTYKGGALRVNFGELIINDCPEEPEEKAPPERPGLVRPDELSTPIHESVHGEAPSKGSAKPKFDRNKYQRELMRTRRGKRGEGITGKEPG